MSISDPFLDGKKTKSRRLDLQPYGIQNGPRSHYTSLAGDINCEVRGGDRWRGSWAFVSRLSRLPRL